jgi:hypothetical protein
MIYYRRFCVRCGYYLPYHAFGCRYENSGEVKRG